MNTKKCEVGNLYKVKYSLVDRGDGVRCAWCDKLNPSQKHLEKHDKLIMNKGGQDDNRKVGVNCCSSKTANVHPKK